VQQVIVDSNAEFTIIPTLGNQLIFFGNAEDIEGKFKKLLNFYTEGLNKTGWNKYATINLKFKNQVVCTKKDIPLIPIAKSESQNGDENNSETKISNQ
jgi:cell division protein FtsQ